MVFQPFEALNFKKKLKENLMNEHSTIENQSISGWYLIFNLQGLFR